MTRAHLLLGVLCSACVYFQDGGPACSDQRVNGRETDVDCGGPSCPPCASSKLCLSASDCVSKSCVLNRCAASVGCGDGIRDGTETDVDCGGGGPCAPCGFNQLCLAPRDCASGVCLGGRCAPPCDLPLLLCPPVCTDPRMDPFNCGMCNHACTNGDVCIGGSCMSPCPMGLLPCGPACVMSMTDRMNCGGCGIVCAPEGFCSAGQCVGGTCQPPLLVCDGGICVDPQNDRMNCGACGNACPPAPNTFPDCQQASCTYGSCVPGFLDCDLDAGDGCETDVGMDSANCGSCGRACMGTDSCMMGQCCGPLPPGTYQATCMGCTACDGTLSCMCQDGAQVYQQTSVPLMPCADFTNCNGVLLCQGC
jgi:hypothetical protein